MGKGGPNEAHDMKPGAAEARKEAERDLCDQGAPRDPRRAKRIHGLEEPLGTP